MGIFSKSLIRELGKNTGKWASNTIFGDSWSTPHRIKVNDDLNTRLMKTRMERAKREAMEAKAKNESRAQRDRAEEKKNRAKKHEAAWVKLLATQLERLKKLADEGYIVLTPHNLDRNLKRV